MASSKCGRSSPRWTLCGFFGGFFGGFLCGWRNGHGPGVFPSIILIPSGKLGCFCGITHRKTFLENGGLPSSQHRKKDGKIHIDPPFLSWAMASYGFYVANCKRFPEGTTQNSNGHIVDFGVSYFQTKALILLSGTYDKSIDMMVHLSGCFVKKKKKIRSASYERPKQKLAKISS